MRIPGFHAEAALDTSAHHDRLSATAPRSGAVVQPALVGGCFRRCLQSCQDDPFCSYNCRCICSGQAGKTCWPI